MKLLAWIVCAVPTVAASPLVSFNGLWELTSETVGLLKDAALYLHDKTLDLVPAESRVKYEELLSQGLGELGKAKTEAYEMVRPSLEIVMDAAVNIYQVADKRTSGLVNTVVVDFERRFPRESGKIGRTLLDRLVLLVYLYVVFKTCQCTSNTLLAKLGCRKRHPATTAATAAGGSAGAAGAKQQTLGNPVVKEFKPPAKISDVASAPPRPSFTPTKPPAKQQ